MHVSKVFPSLRDTLPRDLMASVVVFLVALPLCMGIAIASGMPPAKGLLTGIVGGLVVGFLAGSPLQVSGPAAGLAVLVFELVRTYGVAMLGPILLLAGAIQLLAGRLRLGCWFRVTSPAVVYGMLAGIGILIVLSQLHVMLDLAPKVSGLDNLLAFPQAAFAALGSLGMDSGLDAALLGLGTIAVIVRQEIVLFIMGGVFVMETLSVMIQVASFKLTGRRVFRMAPIHHHFELKGWPEPRVIVRFWIITVILVLIGLATLKLR